jgi:hypothetical protein
MRQVQARRVIPFPDTVIAEPHERTRSDDDFEPSRLDSDLECAAWLQREALADAAAGFDPLDEESEGGECDLAPWRFSFVDGAVLLVVVVSALWAANLLHQLWRVAMR